MAEEVPFDQLSQKEQWRQIGGMPFSPNLQLSVAAGCPFQQLGKAGSLGNPPLRCSRFVLGASGLQHGVEFLSLDWRQVEPGRQIGEVGPLRVGINGDCQIGRQIDLGCRVGVADLANDGVH
jgi:hypothetical protein